MPQATYSGIGASITVRIQLKDLTVEDRRSMFRDLLMDAEANPVQLAMTADERREVFAALDRFGGWNLKGGR